MMPDGDEKDSDVPRSKSEGHPLGQFSEGLLGQDMGQDS